MNPAPPLLLVALLSVTGCASNWDTWTPADARRQYAIVGLQAVDGYTTTKIQYTPGVQEGTPLVRRILGSQPSTSGTYQWMIGTMVLDYVVARSLPTRYRTWWQVFRMLDHTSGIYKNCTEFYC